jgi:amidase
MTNTLGGITTFMRAVISGRPWTKDPYAIRKAWDEDAYMLSEHGHGNKLCVGIMWHNANVLPHPPVTRGLNIVKEALLAAGHEGMCASTRLYCF